MPQETGGINGGMYKKEVPTIGFTPRCLDPFGNIFGLIQPF